MYVRLGWVEEGREVETPSEKKGKEPLIRLITIN
jgi:hypothetical protein